MQYVPKWKKQKLILVTRDIVSSELMARSQQSKQMNRQYGNDDCTVFFKLVEIRNIAVFVCGIIANLAKNWNPATFWPKLDLDLGSICKNGRFSTGAECQNSVQPYFVVLNIVHCCYCTKTVLVAWHCSYRKVLGTVCVGCSEQCN